MAKKVNKSFLLTIAAVGGGLIVALGITYFVVMRRHSSAYYLQKSTEAEQAGDVKMAYGFMSPATGKDPGNKVLYVRQGDLAARLVSEDPRYLGNSELAYRHALEIDPGYGDAIDRLLKNNISRLRAGFNTQPFFKELKDVADKGVASDPNNAHYAAWAAISILQPWIVSTSSATPAIERTAKSLSDLAAKHPEEYDAAFYASLFDFRQYQQLKESKKDAPAKAVLDQIAARHQAAIKARPQDVDLQLRAFQIFSELARLDADRKDDFSAQAKAAIVSARTNARADDDLFDEICHWQIVVLLQDKAPREEIEKAYAVWAAARPHDAFIRLEHAQYLGSDPAHRAEAIALLAAPVTSDPNVTGFAAVLAKGNERGTLLMLNNFRADDAQTAPPAEKAKIVALIDSDLTRIQAMGNGEDPALLKLRGKSLMLQNRPTEALPAFIKAQAMLGPGTFEPDLWIQLQRAYVVTNQVGSAQRMMEELLVRMPGNSDIRTRLAQLYLVTGQLEKAKEQLKIVDLNPPKDPALLASIEKMKTLLANTVQPGGQDALPEATQEQQIAKAQSMITVERWGDAIRLYRLVTAADPANAQAGPNLIALLLRDKKNTEAMEVVDNALKAKPDDVRWQNARKQLSATTPADQRKFQEDLIAQIPDPIMRELRLVDVALSFRDVDSAQKHFAAAEKIDPKDSRVMLGKISFLMGLKKYDEAARALEAAATANADHMNGLSLRTRMALVRNNREDALKYGNQLVSQFGEFGDNWYLYGQAQQASGLVREAVGSFDAAIQRQPNIALYFQGKAQALDALGQYAPEKDAITQARRLAPMDRGLRDLELNWELHHGDPDKVVATCQDLLKVEPENVAIYGAYAQASRAAADLKYRADGAKYKQMLESAKAVLDDGFKRFGTTPDVARLYGPQALVLDGLGDAAGAENALKLFAALPESVNSPQPSEELAKFYEAHKRIPEAEAQWKDAYTKAGQTVEAELTLAQFYSRQGRPDDALKTLTANATDLRVQRQRIEVLLSKGDMAGAKVALNAAYGTSPTDPIALYYRGIINLRSNDTVAAVNDLTSSRDKDPENVMTRMWLARALIVAGQRDNAAVQLEYVVQRVPLRDDARQLLISAYASEPPRWLDHDRIVQDALQNPTLNTNPQWYQDAARSLARRGQYDGAKQQIAAAQKLAPDAAQLQEDYISILVQAKDWPAVIAETDKQIAAGHKEGTLYGFHAVARAGLKDNAGALKDFDTAIASYQVANNIQGVFDILETMNQVIGHDEALTRVSLLPDTIARDRLTATIVGQKGDFAQQAQIIEGMLAKNPNLNDDQKAELYNTDAMAYLQLGQWDKARRVYDQLLTIRPGDVGVLNNVAYLLADKLKTPIDAKSYSKRAYDFVVSHGNTIPGVLDTHGWILTLCGGNDAKDGLRILRNLVDSNQNLTKSRYHLAYAYMRADQPTSAAEQLKIIQSQIDELRKNNQPVDAELLDGVKKLSDEVRQKTGLQ